MKKSKKNLIISLILLALCVIMLVSCGASDKSSLNSSYDVETPEENADKGMSGGELDPDATSISSDRKLIRTINLEVQTKSFDSFISYVNNAISRCGGYVESSRTDGVNIYVDNNRNAMIVARIPFDKTDEFINGFPSEDSNIVSSEENSKDITLSYVDAESRLSSLRSQRQALEALYEKATTVEEIAYVQKELSSVISDIEAYEARLREYQSLVSYSTVTLNISEVEAYTEKAEKKLSEQISDGFSKSLDNVGIFFRTIFVFAIVNIPYILIWGIPVTVIIIILIIVRNKNKKKKN